MPCPRSPQADFGRKDSRGRERAHAPGGEASEKCSPLTRNAGASPIRGQRLINHAKPGISDSGARPFNPNFNSNNFKYMKTIENTISSPFNNWFAFQKSLDWSDDRTQHENMERTFLEALRQGISRSKAFYEVANRINQAGRTVNWQKLHDLWHLVRDQWNALRSGQGVNPAAPIPPVLNGHGAQNVVSAPGSETNNSGHHHNGHHRQHNWHKPIQRGGASLISYYV